MGIGLTIIGIGVVIYALILNINLKKAPVDLYEVDWNTLKPYQHVEFDLDFLMDCYMYYEKDGSETSRFYALPELYADEEGYVNVGRFMGIAVAKADFDRYEKIVDNSYAWWNDTEQTVEFAPDKIHIDGYLRKMSSNDKKYMTKYLTEDLGYSSDEAAAKMTKYVIMTNTNSTSGMMIAGFVIAVVGVVFLVMTIIRYMKGR